MIVFLLKYVFISIASVVYSSICISSSSVYSPFSDRVRLPPHNTPFPGLLIKSNGAAFFTTRCPSDVSHMRGKNTCQFNYLL